MEDDNKKHGIYDDNNIDLDKKAIEMELSSRINSTQRDCNPAVVKLELFGNIPFILDVNDLEHHKETVYRVESSSAERNPSVIKRVESSSTEYNPPVV